MKNMNPLTLELIGNDFSETTETISDASGDFENDLY